MSELHRPAIAILASGSGTTAEAFIHATQEGVVDAEVGLVVCNNPPEKAGIYDRMARLSREYGLTIPVLRISGVTHPEGPGEKGEMTLEESEAICNQVNEVGCSLVALMGYMKKIRGAVLEAYGWPGSGSFRLGRMLNTHPGPLPETAGFFGINVQEEVLRLGLPYSAHTVHLVTGGYDEGPIIEETKVPVLPNETPESLFDRVQIVEKQELPLAIRSHLYQMGLYR